MVNSYSLLIKIIITKILLISITSIAVGQNTTKEDKLPKKFDSLNDNQKNQLIMLLRDAAKLVNGVRVQESLEKIISAEDIVTDYAPLLNLKGAAYTKVRDFDKAQSAFAKALKIEPKGVMTSFNLYEMYFVKKQYKEAESSFKSFLELNKNIPESTIVLVKYKILICALKQDNTDQAKSILDQFDFLDDYPLFYYANAAMHFHNNEVNEANSWLIAASKIYKPSVNDLYKDSLIEAGWLENIE